MRRLKDHGARRSLPRKAGANDRSLSVSLPNGRKPIMTALAGWENFYVIVGSSAGALIGLQFVVITLIADMPIAPGQAQAGDAFATPTVVHFAAVLLLSAIVSAPWRGIGGAAVLWALLGLT